MFANPIPMPTFKNYLNLIGFHNFDNLKGVEQIFVVIVRWNSTKAEISQNVFQCKYVP